MVEQTASGNRERGCIQSLLFLAVITHVLIPKSGIKFHEMPITLPDLIYFFLLFLSGVAMFATKRVFLLPRIYTVPLCVSISYLALLTLCQYLFLGRDKSMAMMQLAVFCFYPLIAFLIYHYFRTVEAFDSLLRGIGWATLVVLLYAIVQKVFGEYNVDILGITANLSDMREYPDLYLHMKNNGIGKFLKASSTYQNGNNFGVNMLLFFPLPLLLMKKKWQKIAYMMMASFAILLSFSRTVWLGYLFTLSFLIIYVIRGVKTKFVAFFVISLLVFAIFFGLNEVRERLHGESVVSLGGRAEQSSDYLSSVYEADSLTALLVGTLPFMGVIYEMTYLAIFSYMGFMGFLVWVAPFALTLFFGVKRGWNDWVIRYLLMGYISYLAAAVFDGVYWLPPTAFNVATLVALIWTRLSLLSHQSQKKPAYESAIV